MLSAINWNACPQSIGIAVRDRWNAALMAEPIGVLSKKPTNHRPV
jgi:hypothetical protein